MTGKAIRTALNTGTCVEGNQNIASRMRARTGVARMPVMKGLMKAFTSG
jgi:hypothetical protein